MRVLVVGLIRNGAQHIAGEVERVHRILDEVGPTEVFIVESDSADSTPDVLRAMEERFPWFSYVAMGHLSAQIPTRTERLAFCRNRYVDEINRRNLGESDLVIAVDFDLKNDLLTAEMVKTAVNTGEWDILTANQKGPYYDIWTLRHPSLSPNDYRSSMRQYRDLGMSEYVAALRTLYARMVTIPTDTPRIAVQSAFGGLAIYRPWVFTEARYAGYDHDGNEVSDHVPFNLSLTAKGAQIFIEPSLVTTGRTEHSSLVGILRARLSMRLPERPSRGRARSRNDLPDTSSLIGSVGIVVPTLGSRPEYLLESLQSIRRAGPAFLAVVRPVGADIDDTALSIVDAVIDDPGSGLAAAINAGIRALPETVEFASWLGDDDRLAEGSLITAAAELRRTGAAAVFGQCGYIDASGRQLWLNKSGRWASPLMLFGPQLVPQPGSLFRRSDFDAIGGLDEARKWAFDLDLFLNLRRQPGGIRYVGSRLADFRWHDGSLSVGGRQGSVSEASEIRRQHLPRPLRAASAAWEPALRWVILAAGERMNRRLASPSTS